jgi:hypothetical protein
MVLDKPKWAHDFCDGPGHRGKKDCNLDDLMDIKVIARYAGLTEVG